MPTPDEHSLGDLSRKERMLLMRFVCSFAWADLEIKGSERALIARMMQHLDLDDSEVRQVYAWLEVPPPAESVDPELIPHEHRMRFLRAVESMVTVDGEVSPEERESLLLFAHLIR